MKAQLVLYIIVLVLQLGCSTTSELEPGMVSPPTGGEPSSPFAGAVDEKAYLKLIDEYSAKDEQYSGFYSTFQYQATLLNSVILEAQLAIKAKDFKWPRETYFAEKEKVSESLAKETKIFMSFFSPVNENDNLNSNKTVWKIWLEVNGVRYEGVASKQPGILAQHQRLFPYHTRFFTPYVLIFKVPTGLTQSTTSKLTLTGPVGTSEVTFPPSAQRSL